MPEPDGKPTNRGHFSRERAQAAAAKRWEKARAAADDTGTDGATSSGPAPGSGLNTGLTERDRDLALKEARRMLKASTTPDAVKAQLIRTLAGIEEQAQKGKPPAVEALGSLSTAELEALLPGPSLAR